jgi:hypothetical protein
MIDHQEMMLGFPNIDQSVVVFSPTIPSGYVKIAIENDHRNSGFSH